MECPAASPLPSALHCWKRPSAVSSGLLHLEGVLCFWWSCESPSLILCPQVPSLQRLVSHLSPRAQKTCSDLSVPFYCERSEGSSDSNHQRPSPIHLLKACASLSIGFSLCDRLIDIIKFGSSVPTPAPAPDLTAYPYIRQRNTARQRAHLLSTGSPAILATFLHAWLQLSEERSGNLLAPKLQPRSAPRNGNGSKV